MAPAEKALAAVAAGITPADPARILLSNLDGAAVDDGAGRCCSGWSRQVTAPVRWDLCMRTLADLGVTGVIELPPAGTLAGLVKRELKGDGAPEIVTLNTPDDLPAARDLIARHGMAPSHEPTMPFRVAVATVAALQPRRTRRGHAVTAGQVSATSRPGRAAEVTAHDSGCSPSGSPTTTTRSPGPPLARIGGIASHDAARLRIVALGHYQPSRVLTNDDLAQMVDTNDEWIRTGSASSPGGSPTTRPSPTWPPPPPARRWPTPA